MQIFIKGNVPSSKNGRPVYGRYLGKSKATEKYIDETEESYKVLASSFRKLLEGKEKPYRIQFTFVRGSRRHFDYINPAQTVQDLMVKYGWLDDDDCDNMIPVFSAYAYDKESPGVYIDVL